MGKLYPCVQRLDVHMSQEQHVLYNSSDPDDTGEALKLSEMTKLNVFSCCVKRGNYYTQRIKFLGADKYVTKMEVLSHVICCIETWQNDTRGLKEIKKI